MGKFIIQQYKQDTLPWWLSGKEPTLQVRKHKFRPWFLKIPWRKKWKPTPVFLPEKSYGQRSLVDYSLYDPQKVSDMIEQQQQQPGHLLHDLYL